MRAKGWALFSQSPIRQRRFILLLWRGILFACVWLLVLLTAPAVQAQQATPTPETPSIDTGAADGAAIPTPPPVPPENLSLADEYCLSCHGQPGQSLTLQDGSVRDLTVQADTYHASVHGEQGYACVQCHAWVGQYPHPAFQAANSRDFTIKLNTGCARCHFDQFELALDSVHAQALAGGNQAAAVCSDCHTGHATQRLTDPETGELTQAARLSIPQTCAQCHSTIYDKYKESVHGEALKSGNPDVPTCIDCHGVHNISNPTTSAFRLNSPKMCSECHTDAEKMDKYDLSTNVLNTYVADFHGTTVALFEAQSPDAETNKPVCYDCHGVHDIKRTDDPEKGLQVKDNLLKRCQVCHPDATANFPSAWLSHYIPTFEKAPLVFTVNTFYLIFIPLVLIPMAVLVALDFSKQLRVRARQRRRQTREIDLTLTPSGLPVELDNVPASGNAEEQAISPKTGEDRSVAKSNGEDQAETTSPPSEDTTKGDSND
jgi:hypothetical protein